MMPTIPAERVVALAGNPNVGKSTLFNALTGMRQHTGNWAGKTVSNAKGRCTTAKYRYTLVDLPGTYSLMARSAEEEVARDYICFNHPNVVVVVCDATCLERNLNLVLQILEVNIPVVICVNLIDEAKRKGIRVDTEKLEEVLGVPVVATVARKKRTLKALLERLDTVSDGSTARPACYPPPIEEAINALVPHLEAADTHGLDRRWLALRLLEQNHSMTTAIRAVCGRELIENPHLTIELARQRKELACNGLQGDAVRDSIVQSLVFTAQKICKGCTLYTSKQCDAIDRRIDRILTGRRFGYPMMLLLLIGILWLTIQAANLPSRLLAQGLFGLQEHLSALLVSVHAPPWLQDALVLGVYRTLAWVVSVMLPPMAMFFPLFTLLEDVGYLPRIAYNLDRPFARCNACGKQALTMCMGFGCNAVGVIGSRIIDSPRERLLAILTNNFVPCNGRFPALLTLLTIFFAGSRSWLAALLLTAVILLGILATFITTRLLATTVLRGKAHAFTLELPPYRSPQVGRVLLRSIFDRTLFVLGRAATVAVPAGLLLWVLANTAVGDASLLSACAKGLDPFARLMGLDGVILLAFILGFPANEIVIPIMLMTYLQTGSLTDVSDLTQLREIFTANGWTPLTAACAVLFFLFHWPCSTTLLTIHKETGQLRWTALAAILPTAIGILLCMALTAVVRLIA